MCLCRYWVVCYVSMICVDRCGVFCLRLYLMRRESGRIRLFRFLWRLVVMINKSFFSETSLRRFLEFLLISCSSKNFRSLTSAKPPVSICLVTRPLILWMGSLTLVSSGYDLSFFWNWVPVLESMFWYYGFVLSKPIFFLCSCWLWFRGWGNSHEYVSKLQVFIGDRRWDGGPSLSATGNKFLPKLERKSSGMLYARLSSVSL